jgi:hypothetical protein
VTDRDHDRDHDRDRDRDRDHDRDHDRDRDRDHQIVSMLTISSTGSTRAGLAPGFAWHSASQFREYAGRF